MLTVRRAPPSDVRLDSLRSPAFESSIAWHDVKISPAARPDFPSDDRPSHYYAARQTDAAPIESGGQKEKFLFYRGIGGFDPPLTAIVNRDGHVVVANPRGEPVGDVMLFENRNGAIAFDVQHAFTSRVTLRPRPLDDESPDPLEALEAILVARGLFPKEAHAMVETWRDSWFEEGARVFYIAPRTMIAAVLPLTVTPAPARIERVFVGRIELVTPAIDADVREAIAANHADALRKYGRFVDAIVGRMLATGTSADRARGEALLQSTRTSWGTSAGACR